MLDPGVTNKADLRQERWRALGAAGAARFPGTVGRIPNFVGAEDAARRLLDTDELRGAKVIKCNPDSPQRPVRRAALDAGITVIMAVPKLADRRCFWRLDPAKVDPWKASSIKGASELGEPVTEREVGRIDLIVTGCVAVGRDGARLGKGGGYSDLEYAVLRELGLVDASTPIATTVHPSQVVKGGVVPVEAHDISIDLFCTPTETVRTGRTLERPAGVLWDRLPDDKREAIPVLNDPALNDPALSRSGRTASRS